MACQTKSVSCWCVFFKHVGMGVCIGIYLELRILNMALYSPDAGQNIDRCLERCSRHVQAFFIYFASENNGRCWAGAAFQIFIIRRAREGSKIPIMNNKYPTALQLTAIAIVVASWSAAIYQFRNQYTLRKATPNSKQRRLCFIASIACLVAAFFALAYTIYYPIEVVCGWTSEGRLAPGEWPIVDIILGIGSVFPSQLPSII